MAAVGGGSGGPAAKRARIASRDLTIEIAGEAGGAETLDVSHDDLKQTLREWLQMRMLGIDSPDVTVVYSGCIDTEVQLDAPISALGLFEELQKDVRLVVKAPAASFRVPESDRLLTHLEQDKEDDWFHRVTSVDASNALDAAARRAVARHPGDLVAQVAYVKSQVRGAPVAWTVLVDDAECGEIPTICLGVPLSVNIRCVDELGLSARLEAELHTFQIQVVPAASASHEAHSPGFDFELKLQRDNQRDDSDRASDDPDVDTSTLSWRQVPLFFFPREQCAAAAPPSTKRPYPPRPYPLSLRAVATGHAVRCAIISSCSAISTRTPQIRTSPRLRSRRRRTWTKIVGSLRSAQSCCTSGSRPTRRTGARLVRPTKARAVASRQSGIFMRTARRMCGWCTTRSVGMSTRCSASC